MKFDFSKSSDLQNKFQYVYSRLDHLQMQNRVIKNNIDELLRLSRLISSNYNLQKQVDDYYGEEADSSSGIDETDQA